MPILKNDALRSFFRGRRRFKLAWIFLILILIDAHHYPTFFGTGLCFLGATLRFLSSGYLQKESSLAIGGPYAHTRNPLYLGTFLMAVGAGLSVGSFLITFFMGIAFFLNYLAVIEEEELRLTKLFGHAYVTYCKEVPRFWPRLMPARAHKLAEINSNIEARVFSLKLSNRNKAFEAYVSFFGMIGGLFWVVWLKRYLGL